MHHQLLALVTVGTAWHAAKVCPDEPLCICLYAGLTLLCHAVEDVLFAGEAKDLLRKARDAQKANTLPAL